MWLLMRGEREGLSLCRQLQQVLSLLLCLVTLWIQDNTAN